MNQALRHALAAVGGWKIIADNFHLRIEGDGASLAEFRPFLGA